MDWGKYLRTWVPFISFNVAVIGFCLWGYFGFKDVIFVYSARASWKDLLDFMTIPATFSLGASSVFLAFASHQREIQKQNIDKNIKMIEAMIPRFEQLEEQINESINQALATGIPEIGTQMLTSNSFKRAQQDRDSIQKFVFQTIIELKRLDSGMEKKFEYFGHLFGKTKYDEAMKSAFGERGIALDASMWKKKRDKRIPDSSFIKGSEDEGI